MCNQKNKIERNSLYNQVWHQPMSKLAPTYGISDVMLKKICRQMDIPTPPRGYWAKVQNNIRVDKVKLPKLKIGQPTTYWIQKRDQVSSKVETEDEKFSEETVQILANINAGKPIKVAKRLAAQHPMIEKTRQILSKSGTNQYGILTGSWKKSVLDIRVSSNMLSRALRIFDSIIKYFNRQAVPVVVENSHRCRDTHVVIFEEKVSFFLREPSRRSDHQLNKEDKDKLKRWSHAFIQKYDYHPSGCLTLEIDNYSVYGVKSRWTDGKKSGWKINFTSLSAM